MVKISYFQGQEKGNLQGLGEVGKRIDRPAVYPHFIMEVGAGGIPRGTHGPQDLSRLQAVPDLHPDFIEVAEHGDKPMPMVETDQAAVF